MIVQARQYSSYAEMYEARKALRQRFYGAVKPKQKPALVVVEKEPEPCTDIPLWKREATQFDAHVIQTRLYIRRHTMTCRDYIKARCIEFGVTYEEIVGPARFRRLAYPRQLLMWEIKTHVKPSISWNELGRLFGGRDHTTALHAVRQVEERKRRGIIE